VIETYKREDVLNFYNKLQFNETSNPIIQAEMIKKVNAVEKIYPDSYELVEAKKIVELGCGAGWLANSIAYYYDCYVEAVDFNLRAIDMAIKTAEKLDILDKVKFSVGDLFTYNTSPADLVISNGVLHHMSNCMEGIKKCISLIKKDGIIFIGLYHKYGRKPFLDYFERLKTNGMPEDELYQEYRRLDNRTSDETQAKSWFMDQVMHPYETQHTLKEVIDLFESEGVRLVKTSINQYNAISSYDDLFEMEKELYEVGEKYLKEGKYFPGYFYCKGMKL